MKALVPVRGGSQRVKNKNIRTFAGSSLLEIKIKQLHRIKAIDEVCVNSDCEDMLEIATRLGATAILRDPYYATNHVPMNEVWVHMAKSMDSDVILYTNVTNPLITDKTYTDICNLWKVGLPEGYDSITTTHLIKEYMWFKDQPINYDPKTHPRSQDLPDYHGLNFAVSIISKKLLIDRKSIMGGCFYPYVLDKVQALDIDEEDDFKLAEFLYSRSKELV